VAVLDLGVRRSQLRQLEAVCKPVVFPHGAEPAAVRACGPAAVFVSDGPAGNLPPEKAIATLGQLVGEIPLLGCGLGHVALGMALGCQPGFLKRGHHGANYPVRNVVDGRAEVTQQRHTVMLDRRSVESSARVELLWENINDGTVEGIRVPDAGAVGLQPILDAPWPGAVNAHIKSFLDGLAGA
jgi:carbamoyl-phosphate synthase small subunit